MRTLLIPTITAISLMALPAIAATNDTQSKSSNMSPQSAAQVEQNLRQDLTKAGYTDIHIMPGSFMVHAKDSKGLPTEMMVTPHAVTSVTAMNAPGSGQKNMNEAGTKDSNPTNK
jgi:hypothetical protein